MSQVTPTTVRPKSAGTGRPILQARGLNKTFRMGESVLHVLRDADLSIKAGEFVAIEGRSGSGKSTLLHILGALDSVDSGSVEFDGHDYTRLNSAGRFSFFSLLTSRRARVVRRALIFAAVAARVVAFFVWPGPLSVAASVLFLLWALLFVGLVAAYVIHFVATWPAERRSARMRNKDFGFVFQFFHLLPELTVLENTLLAPMTEHGWLGFRRRRGELRERAVRILTDLGLDHRLRHRPSQLSGGERQRVAIARALMNDPKVLFADEPTGNLDAETGTQIMSVLESLHRNRGQTVVMVTHDRTLARQADRVLVLKEGRLERAE